MSIHRPFKSVLFRVLWPGLAVLGRFHAGWKFGIVLGVASLALCGLAVPYVTRISNDVDYTRDELDATRLVVTALEISTAVRELKQMALGLPPRPELLGGRMPQDLLGAELPRLGMLEKGRPQWGLHDDVEAASACLAELPVVRTADVQTVLNAHARCVDRFTALAAKAADASGLVLDPEGPTYYVMDLLLERLVPWQDAVCALSSERPGDIAGTLQMTPVGRSWLGERGQLATLLTRAHAKRQALERSGASGFDAWDGAVADTRALQSYLEEHVHDGVIEGPADVYRTKAERARASIRALRVEAQARLEGQLAQRLGRLERQRLAVIAGVAAMLAVNVYGMCCITFGIIWGVSRLLRGMKKIADGDLSVRVQMPTRDELADLAGYTNRLAEQLEGIVSALAGGSTNVAAAGDTMSMAAQVLAIRTEQQASNVQQTSVAVREVAGKVHATADHAKVVDACCSQLCADAAEGLGVVDGAMDAIARIEHRSKEMREVLTLIESVAFQTNILALNAAVEAARAGPAGRGFAVVAAEVRSLALSTTESSAQIKNMIEGASDQVAQGVAQVRGVKRTLGSVVDSINDVSRQMREVATDSTRQSEALEQIQQSLDQLTELTKANASMVAESVSAAEGMRGNAQDLKEIVARIKVHGAQTVLGPAAVAPAQAQVSSGVEFF